MTRLQPGAWNSSIQVPHVVGEAQAPEPSSAAFLCTSARSWMGRGAAWHKLQDAYTAGGISLRANPTSGLVSIFKNNEYFADCKMPRHWRNSGKRRKVRGKKKIFVIFIYKQISLYLSRSSLSETSFYGTVCQGSPGPGITQRWESEPGSSSLQPSEAKDQGRVWKHDLQQHFHLHLTAEIRHSFFFFLFPVWVVGTAAWRAVPIQHVLGGI